MWVLVFRPVWNRSSALPRLVADTFGIMMAALLLRAEPLVTLSQDASPPYGGEDIVSLVNLAVRLGLIAFFLVSIVEVLRRLWKLQREDGRGSPERAA